MNTTKIYSHNNILEAIYNLDSIVRNIKQVKAEAMTANLSSKSLLGGDVELYSYIKIRHAYVEIDLLYRYSPSCQLLSDILYCVKPLLKIIRRYENGIVTMRNKFLAHFNRDSKGNFDPYWLLFRKSELPQEPGELELIYDSLDILRVILVHHFHDDLIPFFEKVRKEVDMEYRDWKNNLKSRETPNLNVLKKEINLRFFEKRLIEEGEDYIGNLEVQETYQIPKDKT